MESYFADARVGDSVYEMVYGEGRIEGIYNCGGTPVSVMFPGGRRITFTLDGKYSDSCNQTLFYSKPIFELPPPPRRTVKKVVEGWVNIYPQGTLRWTSTVYKTEAWADEAAQTDRLGKAHHIRHEYWVEE